LGVGEKEPWQPHRLSLDSTGGTASSGNRKLARGKCLRRALSLAKRRGEQGNCFQSSTQLRGDGMEAKWVASMEGEH